MKILLVQPSLNWLMLSAETPSRALLILGTQAEKQGHTVKILHLDIEQVPYADTLLDFMPDVVGITVNTFQVQSARNIVKLTRQVIPEAKIVIGGPHAVVWEEEQKDWADSDKVDKIIVGEGEKAWQEVIGGDYEDTPINYDLVDFSRFTGIGPLGASPSMAVMASRGCPNQCSFCNTPVFWGKKVRYREPEQVVDEVELLHRKYGVREIFFQDDTFNLNHKWAFKIFEGIINRGLSKRMVFKIDCRVNENLLTEEFLDMAKLAGVWNIFYGVESGSPVMLERMHKNITVPEIKRAFKLTHERRIHTQASFIVGLPGETLGTLAETDKLIHDVKPNLYGWCFFCPFPNTEATKEVITAGHRRNVDYGDYGYGKVLARTDALDYTDLECFKGFSYGKG